MFESILDVCLLLCEYVDWYILTNVLQFTTIYREICLKMSAVF